MNDPIDVLLERIAPAGLFECWLWTGYTNEKGYGRFRRTAAHKFVYELYIAPVPEGCELDHRCCTPACVNPMHLDVVTHAENIRRRDERGRHAQAKTCKKGHPWEEGSFTVRISRGKPCRLCLICNPREARRGGRRLTASPIL